VDGLVAVVGAPYRTYNSLSQTGAVYIFKVKCTQCSTNMRFGASLRIRFAACIPANEEY
jgi:hypothetical protein